MSMVSITARSPVDREHLQRAFAVFSQASEQLSGAYRDLQDQVECLTRELAAANAELARNQRLSAMGEMAARLAHQLRTPLATALLYTGHLTQPCLGHGVRVQFAQKALSRLRHLEQLIGDMLLFVKGETGEAVVVAVAGLLAELQQVMAPQMARHGLRLSIVDLSGGAAVTAERKALTGALVSLLENALQASAPGGSVTLTCEATAEALTFRVRDEGCGIPFELQARLFEPFFTTRAEGTGLGLAIVRGTAQSLGGAIDVVSAPHAGAEFIMRLPRATPQQRRAAAREHSSESEVS